MTTFMSKMRLLTYSVFFTFIVIVNSCQNGNEDSGKRLDNIELERINAVKSQDGVDTSVIFRLATDLTRDYIDNEIRADKDYKDKQIVVQGIISDIKKGISGNAFIVLEGATSNRSVQCYMKDVEEIETLKKGDKVFIIGICDGLWVNVIMSSCIRLGEFVK